MFFSVGITFFMLFGARSLWRRDRAAALPYVILVAVFPITYYLTHASPDYRQPIEPEILALVSVGLLSFREFGSRSSVRMRQEQYAEDERSLVVSTTT